MNAKRFTSEPLILAFVALVDLAAVAALVICHKDVTVKESKALAEQMAHQAVAARTPPTVTQLVHYSPAAINTLLHPVAGKVPDPAHPLTPGQDQTMTAHQ